uniref:lipid A deacylase LpxR family protein n=1 Tax=Thaumasiovibrio occultus TaxID=1891184 RepID=UPI000B35AF35|nr:lipid A deacylase LpxR family protein [Thaumasiovibrio occultus]
MKYTYIPLLSSLVALPVSAATITLSHDNDGLMGTDKNYSAGMFAKYSSDLNANQFDHTPFLSQITSWLGSDGYQGWSVMLSQRMWTPSDIEATVPLVDDRPYAGTLFVTSEIHQLSAGRADKLQLAVGVIGPAAMAEHGQTWLHDIIGSETPNGWDYQIDDQLLIQLNYEHYRTLLTTQLESGNAFDLSWNGRIGAGNFRPEVGAGAVLRFGRGLENTQGSVTLNNGMYVDSAMLTLNEQGWFGFVGGEGRYRFDDVTISGDKAGPDHHFDVQREQWSVYSGMVYYKKNWGASFALVAQAKDYQQDNSEIYGHGSMSVFYRY